MGRARPAGASLVLTHTDGDRVHPRGSLHLRLRSKDSPPSDRQPPQERSCSFRSPSCRCDTLHGPGPSPVAGVGVRASSPTDAWGLVPQVPALSAECGAEPRCGAQLAGGSQQKISSPSAGTSGVGPSPDGERPLFFFFFSFLSLGFASPNRRAAGAGAGAGLVPSGALLAGPAALSMWKGPLSL